VAVSFRLRGLSFRYPGGRADVLAGLTLDLPADQTTVVLGQSGSGKSTLLSLLGLLWQEWPAGKGRITYDGPGGPVDYHGLSAARQAKLRRNEFGFVLQSSYLLPHFSGFDNVAMPLYLRSPAARPAARAQVRRAAEALRAGGPAGDGVAGKVAGLIHGVSRPDELLDLCLKPASQASGGQRQRLAVLRAVVHDPRVLFADEPFSNLDPATTKATLDLLQSWREGGLGSGGGPRTLLLVCHNLRVAFRQELAGRPLADQFLILSEHGSVVRDRLLPRAELEAEVHANGHDFEKTLECLLAEAGAEPPAADESSLPVPSPTVL
jgi:ABC-type lipoprotein export system ATPase subunit